MRLAQLLETAECNIGFKMNQNPDEFIAAHAIKNLESLEEGSAISVMTNGFGWQTFYFKFDYLADNFIECLKAHPSFYNQAYPILLFEVQQVNVNS